MKKEQLVKMIDHTNLQPFASVADIEKLCKEAAEWGFYAVCLNPCYLGLAKQLLSHTEVKLCTVVGFPLGANSSETKVDETKRVVELGVDEVDMVINLGLVKSGAWNQVAEEIRKVTLTAKETGKRLDRDVVVKVIVETCYLQQEEKVKLCQLVGEAGADFIKTSTGFGTGGANVEDVSLFKQVGKQGLQIKASGGIKTLEQAIGMANAGANRLGLSSSVAILREMEENC